MNACIDEYIARLPASYRSVVILNEHEGLPNQEIADSLGVSLETVKIRLHRARARVRQDLGSGCSFYRDEGNEFACQAETEGCIPERVTSVYTWRRQTMGEYTPDYSLDVQAVKGLCPVGETYAKEQIAARTTPVLTCEGPCIRGEIARQAGNLIARELPSLARACHGEAFFVPHSAMASWVKSADRIIMIDGCFLKCHGRVLKTLVPEEKVIHIDALPLYKKYTDVFDIDDVPEEERKAVAREVADKIIVSLKSTGEVPGAPANR